MERGIKDEGFISKALDIASYEDGRWIANQSCFNNNSDSELYPSVKAALVTAVNIYVQKKKIEESNINKALAVKTIGEARQLIDDLSCMVRE